MGPARPAALLAGGFAPARTPTRRRWRRWRLAPAALATIMAAAGAWLLLAAGPASAGAETRLGFERATGAYSGLTFTFDPRLDKRAEWVHFEHWLAILQQTSEILHEALGGRAHLAEVRVLVPLKWRHLGWAALHKPGSPVMANRRLRYADSDVMVGFEDPVHGQTPFAVQHDECGQPGLNIQLPVSFLEQAAGSGRPALEPRLRGRQLAREFASYRFGVFKESGFRADFMYPPFASLAGLEWARPPAGPHAGPRWAPALADAPANHSQAAAARQQLAGFGPDWRECAFDTSPASGLPASARAAACLPYLVVGGAAPEPAPSPPAHASFNLMSSDPFSQLELTNFAGPRRPLEWARELAGRAHWHLCGNNADFQPPPHSPGPGRPGWFEHNQRASNKQNKMCHERSALDVIGASDDFRRAQPSPSTFNRLPTPSFKFLQEMPPRLIMCFEYTSHLYQSHRLDHGFIEAIINKFLAFDLIAETELATVVFGQHNSRLELFQRLESSLSSRFTLFNPAIDPFDEQLAYYSAQELIQLDSGNNVQAPISSGAANNGQHLNQARIIKGTCSLTRMLAEVNTLLQRCSQYDDVGADLIVITSGLFVEDELRIEELIRGSNFKLENNRLHLIVYPSTMLFDTTSRDGFFVLDSQISESIIRQRINKLLLIQKLTNGQIHLVKEHLDSQGDIKSATITQFYQIFDKISKGHSWDQTQSMQLLDLKPIQPTLNAIHHHHLNGSLVAGGINQLNSTPGPTSKLVYQFEVDSSVTNELLVGLIEPRSPNSNAARAGRRFSLKNLQLKSPAGQMIFTETQTWSTGNSANNPQANNNSVEQSIQESNTNGIHLGSLTNGNHLLGHGQESAFFPYRAQLSLAAFHIKSSHLMQLNVTGKLAGLWTLTATTEEPIQTSGVAMARVNPTGDSLTANCWVQTYYQSSDSIDQTTTINTGQPLKSVKVFAQVRGGQTHQVVPSANLMARLEVQDQLGNIVQNVNMLDDGLGSPDMTQNDGIWSQLVQRAHRPGFYRVSVELTSASSGPKRHSPTFTSGSTTIPSNSNNINNGQDNVCCGSFIPIDASNQVDTRHVTRQLYCGTFYVDERNKLAEQRPPRVNNLTIVNVDQEQRRITLRWFEPQAIDVSMMSSYLHQQNHQMLASASSTLLSSSMRQQSGQQNEQQENDGGDLLVDESATQAMDAANGEPLSRRRRQQLANKSAQLGSLLTGKRQLNGDELDSSRTNIHEARGLVTGTNTATRLQATTSHDSIAQMLMGRYEIKMFTDRDMIKRAFEAKQEVGFKFNEWNIEGTLPNATNYGGMKEITLRVPPIGREGVYYIAMKVYNNVGLASQMSNIIQFYLRFPINNGGANANIGDNYYNSNNANFTLIDGLLLADFGPSATIDAEGNIYDKNTGELIQRANYGQSGSTSSSSGPSSFSLINYSLDSLSVLILFSLLAFIMSIVCVTLVACLASSMRKSVPAKRVADSTNGSGNTSRDNADDDDDHGSDKKLASSGSVMTGAGSGSSMVSASEVGSSASSGHDVDINKLAALGDELTYSHLQHQQRDQQHQAQMIQSQYMMSIADEFQQQQQMSYYSQQQQNSANPTQHTIVNGYTYATVANGQFGSNKQQSQQLVGGDLNQNGLELTDEMLTGVGQQVNGSNNNNCSQTTAWPADILLSHYDKVKQARERNEAPPIMRVETLEQQGAQADGLPTNGGSNDAICSSASYLVRAGNVQARNNYLNQQLQQQLSTVLRNKQHQSRTLDTSPALDGITGEFNCDQLDHQAASVGTNPLAAYGSVNLPPPPQYIYCSPTGAQVPTTAATDPSIYSQVTNLQQVISQPATLTETNSNYYANYYDHEQQGQNNQYNQHQHHQQQLHLHDDEFDKSNSAISEV